MVVKIWILQFALQWKPFPMEIWFNILKKIKIAVKYPKSGPIQVN